MPQGLAWMPSWYQVSTSKNSSRVPNPPGIMTKASDESAIAAFLSCMVSTTSSLVSPRWATSRSSSGTRDHAVDLAPCAQRPVG